MTARAQASGSGTRKPFGPIGWAEQGLVPDRVIRAGIRRLNRRRLEDIRAQDVAAAAERLNGFAEAMQSAPIAPVPELANEQHYEVPAEFFAEVMGRHRKYSCCHWDANTRTLDDAEASALEISCDRAGIADGMAILDLGCGWGSLSLWIAAEYPQCRIVAVSNSASQRAYIASTAHRRGLENIEVLTSDMNDFDTEQRFDRVVSVEMFEHMRNYPELFRRISGWLNPGGKFFMHIFCHRNSAYEFVDNGPADWMSRHFFSGGIMPSADLPLRFQKHLSLQRQWCWSGAHYEKTANAWLENMDANRAGILPVMADTYGAQNADLWFMRWRIFFMACAELFGHDRGREWYVSHYLFGRNDDNETRQ